MSRTTDLTTHGPRRSGASFGAVWGVAGKVARRALGWPGRVYRARQLMHELARLGDHGLRDIGLTRLDLHAASALPFDADPSLLLRRRAEERRRRR